MGAEVAGVCQKLVAFGKTAILLSLALTYFIIGHTVGPLLSPLGSVVFSMTSFHGGGFFPGGIALDDPLTVVAALEALSAYSLKSHS